MLDNDLISRAAAIDAIVSVTAFSDAEYIKNLCKNPANSEDWLGGVCDAINAVEDVNAIDAVPVVHRRWIEVGDFIWKCSVCGAEDCYAYTWGEVKRQDDLYCPKCGAKMDRGENDAGQ